MHARVNVCMALGLTKRKFSKFESVHQPVLASAKSHVISAVFSR